MIVFDLRCGTGHVFEAWFGSGAAYDEQRAAGQVSCPLCGDLSVTKAAMAPAVPAKGNSGPPPAMVKAFMSRLAAEQAKALKDSTWVGGKFPEKARAMHAGEEAHAVIHGQATLAEAQALVDEGVPVAPLPLPVVPPEQKN
ncbi:MAG: hypothetical protein JWN21_794 [Sphingomonas bacterium]|uniref:DUF1178 family protein n=1 Tax=Sphingomonas bacterium TaxID=1895847 RepID=UPI002625874C|nr:DUF1178 family protein [Sphingomonas bacterium]MDB5695251.1 hypothetical protein [Sphingomonas bacterium]